MAPHQTPSHTWYTPADCAAMLGGVRHGPGYRAACPAHGGDNTQGLRIAEGKDRDGHPMTLMHCFIHDCAIDDICAAMGIDVRQLFCIHPTYAKATRQAPRSRSPRVAQLRRQETPATSDEIAAILLEEMIVSDPEWIETCAPARAKLWELAQASALHRARFTYALQKAHLPSTAFWQVLALEYGGAT